MLESRQIRLLFKDYHSLPDGRVNLVPCTLVVLPDRNRVAADGQPGRTLVLRAPQGAVLEFDEPLDLRQGRLAKLIGGSLRGQVTIRGTPTAPGAEDDVEIVTHTVRGNPYKTPVAEAISQATIAAAHQIWGEPPLVMGVSTQGTIMTALPHPAVLSGFGAPDNNLHAPNENMPVERYLQGIRFAATIFQEFASRT